MNIQGSQSVQHRQLANWIRMTHVSPRGTEVCRSPTSENTNEARAPEVQPDRIIPNHDKFCSSDVNGERLPCVVTDSSVARHPFRCILSTTEKAKIEPPDGADVGQTDDHGTTNSKDFSAGDCRENNKREPQELLQTVVNFKFLQRQQDQPDSACISTSRLSLPTLWMLAGLETKDCPPNEAVCKQANAEVRSVLEG